MCLRLSGYGSAGGFVDGLDGFEVGEAEFAGGLGGAVVADAVGEFVSFKDELVGHFAGRSFVDGGAVGEVAGEAEAVVVVGGFEEEPAFVSVDFEAVWAVGTVGGAAGGDDAGGELHGPLDGLFDLGEAGAGLAGGDDGGVGGGGFAGDVTDGVEGIDAEIEDGAAAGEGTVEAPGAGALLADEGSGEGLDLADGAIGGERAEAFDDGIVPEAVSDHEVDVVGAAGVDHAATLGGRDGHGLFAEDVLAGFGGADGEVAVHGVGEADVYGVDGGVVADGVVGVVGVDGVVGEVVALAVGLALFVGMSGDDGGEFGLGGLGEGLREDAGDGAEANGGVADGPGGGSLGEKGGGKGFGGEGEGRELGEVAAIHADYCTPREGELGRGRSRSAGDVRGLWRRVEA